LTALTGLLGRACGPTAALVAALVTTLGGLAVFTQGLLLAPITPDPELLVPMALASIAVTLPLGLPVGALAGLVAGSRGLRDDGAWLALSSLGVPGRSLVGAALLQLVPVAVLWSLCAHAIEPRARARLRDLKVEAATRVEPRPGLVVALGPWTLAPEGEQLAFASGDWVGVAERWRVDPAEGSVVLTAESVAARDARGGARLELDRAVVPVRLGTGDTRVHVSERTTPDLLRQIAVSEELGRDLYERWILWKRSVLPLALLPLGVSALPLGLGPTRPTRRLVPVAVWVGTQVGSLWALTRIADQSISVLGLSGATALVLAGALAWPLAAWLRWEPR